MLGGWYIEQTFYKMFLNRSKIAKKQTSYCRQNVVPRDRSNLLYPFYLSKTLACSWEFCMETLRLQS